MAPLTPILTPPQDSLKSPLSMDWTLNILEAKEIKFLWKPSDPSYSFDS